MGLGTGSPRRVELVACGLFAAFIAFLVFEPGSDRFVTAVDDLTQLFVPALAAVLALAVARAQVGRLRATWTLIALACGSWAAGQLVWVWYEVVRDVAVPNPSLADVGYLLAIPLLLVGLVRYPAAGLLPMGRLRLALDATAVGVGLLFAAHGLFLDAVIDAGDMPILAHTVVIAYPVADVIGLAVVIPVLLRRRDGQRGPLPLLLAALVGLAISDCAFAYQAVGGEQLGDAPTNAGWVAGFGLIALAARRARSEPHPAAAAATGAGRSESLVPAVPVVLAAAVLTGRAVAGENIGPLLGLTGGALLLCLAARQIAIQLENRELNDNLRTTVEQLQAREDELRHRAFHDPLTGLANRDLFRNRLEHALSRRRRTEPVTIAFVDLDDFKTVNDSLGHDAGDNLLRLVAERLRACTRSGDTVARLGGDEFAVLIDEGMPDELGQRILQAFDVSFSIGARDLEVDASVGVATGSAGTHTAEQLLQDADLAMYAAKGAGKGQSASFQPAMREGAIERLDLLHDLDAALDRDELILHFQPYFDLASGALTGYEALLRWEHPTRGVLPPNTFLDLAEETGRIEAIGWWALEQACRAQVDFPVQSGLPAPTININLSARQLLAPSAPQAVAHAIAVSGVDAGRVVLELTESILLVGDDVSERMQELRRLGVQLAVDDFGTGYSSLAYLARLPIDIVKIDRSFVERMRDDGEELLIGAIVQLAKGLALHTVAEGVEHPWQLERLRALGCDAAQGYLLGMPAPLPAELERHDA